MEKKAKSSSTVVPASYLSIIGVLGLVLVSCFTPTGPTIEEAKRRYQTEQQELTRMVAEFKKQEEMLKASADLAARRGATDEQLARMEADITHAVESFRTQLQEQQDRVNRAREVRDSVSPR